MPDVAVARYRRRMSAIPRVARLRTAIVAAIAAVLLGLTGCNDAGPAEGGTQQEDGGGGY